jgi:predicted nucleic acid-binding protein
MLPSVYIETTIPSYLTSRPSRDIIRAAHQQLTKDWWQARRQAFRLFTSTFVLDEAKQGDPEAAQARLSSLEDIPLLPVIEEVVPIALRICSDAQIPDHSKMDAAHLAIASVYSIDFFMTWNCTHLNNAQLLPIIEKTISACGYSCPVVCTPEELMGLL